MWRFRRRPRQSGHESNLSDVGSSVGKATTTTGDGLVSQLLDFGEPGLHIVRLDRLNAQPNSLIFRQSEVLQRLEHAVLVNGVNLGHESPPLLF
jgi:hypothetical protein